MRRKFPLDMAKRLLELQYGENFLAEITDAYYEIEDDQMIVDVYSKLNRPIEYITLNFEAVFANVKFEEVVKK